MATKKQEQERDLKSRELDGGTPELENASDAIAAGIYDPSPVIPEPPTVSGPRGIDRKGKKK